MHQGNARAVPVSAPECVFQPQLQWIHAKFFRQAIYHLLDGECYLGYAESAHGSANRIVGIDAPALNQNVGNAIRPTRMLHAQFKYLSSKMGVCAGIIIQSAFQTFKRSVSIGAKSIVQSRRVSFISGDKAFLTIPPHFYGPTIGIHCSKGQQTLNRSTVLASEPTTQIRADDADRRKIKPQCMADLHPIPKRCLG